MSAEQSEFDRLHGIGTNEEHSIFTDRDPATSIKGCGFKNRSTALQTLLLVEQPGSRYKQYWTIRAMLERAKRHPVVVAAKSSEERASTSSHEPAPVHAIATSDVSKTSAANDMLEAIRIFEQWLKERENSKPADFIDNLDSVEMVRRKRFASNRVLNRHGGTALQERLHGDEMQKQLRQDQAEGKKALQQAAATVSSGSTPWFELPGPSLSAMFGGPGIHGYGKLVETDASENGGAIQKLIVSVRSTRDCDIPAGHEQVETPSAGDQFAKTSSESNSEAPRKRWLDDLRVDVGITRHSLVEREMQVLSGSLTDPGGILSLKLGKEFKNWESFDIEYDVATARARFLSWKLKSVSHTKVASESKRQVSVLDFFSKKRRANSQSGDGVSKPPVPNGVVDEQHVGATSAKRTRNEDIIVLSD